VFVGAAAVTVVTVLGFTAGVFFPGRFTAPLVAILVLVLNMAGFRASLGVTGPQGTYALLSPDNSVPRVDVGVYYHVAPDLSVAQVMFMGGIAVALFGVLGLAPGLRELVSAGGLRSLSAVFARGDGWLLRVVTVVLIACGVAASSTGFALAGTAPLDAAQQAVEDVLLTAVGSQPLGASSGHTAVNGKLSDATLADISAAAQRFGALPASARHTWLTTHLAALRAGAIALAQLP